METKHESIAIEILQGILRADIVGPLRRQQAVAYALRAIEERRELLAVLKETMPWATGTIDDEGDSRVKEWRALIAKCEAP